MRFPTIFLSVLLSSLTANAAEVLFQDDFDGGTLKLEWLVSGTGDYKVSIRNDYGPASGTGHLVFEDSVADATYSVSEASLLLDLRRKKDVVLTFKAKSLGDEPHPLWYYPVPREFDGVSVSVDGLEWYPAESLVSLGPDWQSVSIPLEVVFGWNGIDADSLTDVRVRFSQYDNAPAPIDGIAIDDVRITAIPDQRVVVELPSAVKEGGGPKTGYVFLAYPQSTAVTVGLAPSVDDQLVLPPTVTIPAGEVSAEFSYSAVDDSVVNLTRYLQVDPVLAGEEYTLTAGFVMIEDNEVIPPATLTVPALLAEGSYYHTDTRISIPFPIGVDLEFTLTSDAGNRFSHNGVVTIPAGQTQAFFNLLVNNNWVSDGDRLVTLTAEHPAVGSVSGSILVKDDELPQLSLQFADTITEGTAITATAAVSRALPHSLTVNLSKNGSNDLTLPAWVVIPAGQTSVTFQISAKDDAFRNLLRSADLSASGQGVASASKSLAIHDNEVPPVLALTLPPQVTEGQATEGNASLSLDAPADVDVTVSFSAQPGEQVNLPAQVIIPAGEVNKTFTISAVNDYMIEVDVNVVVTAWFLGTPVTGTTAVKDDEKRELSVFVWSSVPEGGDIMATVSIPGMLDRNLEISLTSGDPARLAVPPTVIIPAGAMDAEFPMSGVDNDLRDGTQSTTISVSAAAFTGAEEDVSITDNDAERYEISPLADLIDMDRPLTFSISAYDVEGNAIQNSGTRVDLVLVKPDGSTQPLSPSFVNLSDWGWSGPVNLPSIQGYGFKIRATDESGVTVDSTAFDTMRSKRLVTGDLVWDAGRSRFYASIPASSPVNAGDVVSIDPQTLQITGSVHLGNDPGQIVMTGGGEFLYVAMNGNGTIAKIDAATLAVLATFPVGTWPSGGILYASDICAVAGRTDTILVSQYRLEPTYYYPYSITRKVHAGVAAYDGGVMRPVKSQGSPGSSLIEPSSDPSVFFGYNNETSEYGVRVLKLDVSGVTQQSVAGGLLGSYYGDSTVICSEGDRIFSSNGVVVDGPRLRRAGTFPAGGFPRPDLAAGRVFLLSGGLIYVCEPLSHSLLRTVSFSSGLPAGSFIRWGTAGLAFRTADSIVLIDNPKLVPGGPPADLAVTIEANPDPAPAGKPVTYTVTVTNHGEHAAEATSIKVTLSSGQMITGVSSTRGTVVSQESPVTVNAGVLAPGESAMLTISADPIVTTPLSCTALAITSSLDDHMADNLSFKIIGREIPAGQEVVAQLGFKVSNLAADPSRRLLWVTTLPSTYEAPLDPTLLGIDPATGLVSAPIPIPGTPLANSMAISPNGRYLYLGLGDVPEVLRYDLSTSPPVPVSIPLARSVHNTPNFARDIEVLDGDGTSFIMVGHSDYSASVYDGMTVRPQQTGYSLVNRIERGSAAGTFVGHFVDSITYTRLLTVNSTGVSVSQTLTSNRGGFDIRSSGNLLLASSGEVWSTSPLAYKFRLNQGGAPCVDAAYKRAFISGSTALYAYDTGTGGLLGQLPIWKMSGNYNPVCLRWGVDGFAFTGGDGGLSVVRWSLAVPPDADLNSDGVADGWDARYFGTSGVVPGEDADGDGVPNGFEYMFATPPLVRNPNPIGFLRATGDGAASVEFRFPVRRGFDRTKFVYEISSDLLNWAEAVPSESVSGTQTIDGMPVDTIDAVFAAPGEGRGFVRLRWKP